MYKYLRSKAQTDSVIHATRATLKQRKNEDKSCIGRSISMTNKDIWILERNRRLSPSTNIAVTWVEHCRTRSGISSASRRPLRNNSVERIAQSTTLSQHHRTQMQPNHSICPIWNREASIPVWKECLLFPTVPS